MASEIFQAAPRSWFSWNFTVMKDSEPVAEGDLSWWGEKGTLTVAGKTYNVYREGFLGGAFVLESGSSVVARAGKPNAFLRRYVVDCGDTSYRLEARSPLSREFILFDGSDEVGSIAPEGFFRRGMRAELPTGLPLPAGVFLIWLVVILWKRSAQAAS